MTIARFTALHFTPRLIASSGIFSYLNSSESKLCLPFRGRGVLLLRPIPSLRLMTRTQTQFARKTICQIRGDEVDSAGTYELAHYRPSAPSPVASSSSSLFGISGSLRNGNSSIITISRTLLAYLVLPHLAPRCCVSKSFEGSKRASPELRIAS